MKEMLVSDKKTRMKDFWQNEAGERDVLRRKKRHTLQVLARA